MDIFKILSRGTKQPNNKASSNTPKLPSSGKTSNPQLYASDTGLADTTPTTGGDLRSHRIKVTLLHSSRSQDHALKSKKRKREDDLVYDPLQTFSELHTKYEISGRLSQNLKAQGYKIPTEVQMGTLPLLLKPTVASHIATDVDLLAVAPTGSGKTLAFLIPAINSMVQRRRKTSAVAHKLEAVVVVPTKELAGQIVNEGRKLAQGAGIRVVEMRKGMRVVEDETILPVDLNSDVEDEDDEDESATDEDTKSGSAASQPLAKADVLVTTPMALLNSLKKSSLPTVRHLILDEADVLLDPLFRDQTLGLWHACSNPDLRVSLWSATMGSNIEALASETIQARQGRLKITDTLPLVRVVVGLKDSAIPNVDHKMIYTATEAGKLLGLRQLIRPTASTTSLPPLRPPFLIFTQTIPRAIALHSELLYDIPAEAGGSSRIAVLHSDLSSSARSNIMSRFRNGEIWVLITTDILSRGVDFRGINGVVNYDVPNSGAVYVHRVGRTGRAGRDGGVAVTFYTTEDIPYVRSIATIIAASEKAASKTGTDAAMQQWLLDALPKVSKKAKQQLKTGGVEARRTKVEGKDKGRISSKSGYERKVENRKKGAIQGSRRRKDLEALEDGNASTGRGSAGAVGDEWGGFDD